jgi:hypothetical protein
VGKPETVQVPIVAEPDSLGQFRADIERAAFEATSAGIARAQRLAGVSALDSAAAADRRGAFAYQAFCRSTGDDAAAPAWSAMSAEQRRPWINAGNAAAASG